MAEILGESKIGGHAPTVSATLTRAAATSPTYSAGDVISDSTSATTLIVFSGCASDLGGTGYIVKALLVTDQAACVAQCRLYLFTASEASVSVPADNAAATTLYVNNAYRVGYIDFPALSAEAGSNTAAVAQVADARLHFSCAASSGSLFGLLVTKTAFTQAASQKFFISLGIDQN